MMYSNFIFNLFIGQNWPPFCQIKPRNVDSFHYRKTRQNILKLLRFHFFPTEARGSLAMLFWEIEFHFLLVFTSKKKKNRQQCNISALKLKETSEAAFLKTTSHNGPGMYRESGVH